MERPCEARKDNHWFATFLIDCFILRDRIGSPSPLRWRRQESASTSSSWSANGGNNAPPRRPGPSTFPGLRSSRDRPGTTISKDRLWAESSKPASAEPARGAPCVSETTRTRILRTVPKVPATRSISATVSPVAVFAAALEGRCENLDDEGSFVVNVEPFHDRYTPFNIDRAHITRNYRWWTAVGVRMSRADDGLTFGTNHDGGVCIHFAESLGRHFVEAVIPRQPPPIVIPEGLTTALDGDKRNQHPHPDRQYDNGRSSLRRRPAIIREKSTPKSAKPASRHSEAQRRTAATRP